MNTPIDQIKKPAMYAGLLLFLLWLPLFVSQIGAANRKQLYMGLPAVRGDAGCAVEAIYQDPGDSDAVFVGSSTMVTAMRPSLIDTYFSQKLGRPAKIQYLYLLRSRPDFHYIELSDYFKSHRTKMVVLAAPQRIGENDEPDETDSDLLRFGEMPEFYEGLSFKSKAAIYGEMVINGPRQLLNAFRPNVLAPNETTREYLNQDVEMRYGHIEYSSVPFEQPNPADLLTPSSPKLEFRGNKSSSKDYEGHFVRKIADLCAAHGAKLLILNLPMSRDPDIQKSPIEIAPGILADNQLIVAADNFELFGNMPWRQIEHDYFKDNQHLTDVGDRIYSAKVLPTIYAYFASLYGGGK